MFKKIKKFTTLNTLGIVLGLCVALFFSVFPVHAEDIDFEPSEGYQQGNILGQNNWYTIGVATATVTWLNSYRGTNAVVFNNVEDDQIRQNFATSTAGRQCVMFYPEAYPICSLGHYMFSVSSEDGLGTSISADCNGYLGLSTSPGRYEFGFKEKLNEWNAVCIEWDIVNHSGACRATAVTSETSTTTKWVGIGANGCTQAMNKFYLTAPQETAGEPNLYFDTVNSLLLEPDRTEFIGQENILWWYYPRDEMQGEYAIPGKVDEWDNWVLWTNITEPPDSNTWAIIIDFVTPDGGIGMDYAFVATSTGVVSHNINRRSDLTNGFYTATARLYYGNEGCDQTLECDLTLFLQSETITFEITDTAKAVRLNDDNLWENWTATSTDEWTTGQPIWDDFMEYSKKTFPLSLYMQFHEEIEKLKHATTTIASVSMDDLLPDLAGVQVDNTNLINPEFLETTLGDTWTKIYRLMTYLVYVFYLIVVIKIMFRSLKTNV